MKKTILISSLLLLVIGFYIYNKKQLPKIKEEKVLYLTSPTIPPSLDPTIFSDLNTAIELCKVYEGLLEYHYLKRPAELIPNLAESMPEISDDRLTYIFKIKKGVYFQDNKCFENEKGRELTANDFVYSFMRFADPKLQSPLYSMIDGKILGLNEWRDHNKNLESTDYKISIKGLEAIDKYSLKITLTKPCAQFLYMLALPCLMAVPIEGVNYYGKEFGNNPVGTGPFIIKKFNPQENKITAYKNLTYREKYYPTDASEECKYLLLAEKKMLPFLDRIETYIILEEQPRWLQFISKKLDVLKINGISDLNKKIKNDKPIEEYEKQGILFIRQPTYTTSMYVMNNNVAPFKDNIYLRQAISKAYDRNKQNELFYDNFHMIAQSIIPPGLSGYEDDFINKNNIYDLKEAKELMIKAGYPDGNGLDPIILDIVEGTRSRQIAEFLQNCLSKIGIKLIISTNSWSEILHKIHSSKSQMYASGWCAAYPDAENFLYLFNSKKNDFSNFNSPKYDKLLMQINSMDNSEKRTEIYKEMNHILAEEVPVLFSMHSAELIFYYSWVLNFQYFDAKKIDTIQYLDIDLDKRKNHLK